MKQIRISSIALYGAITIGGIALLSGSIILYFLFQINLYNQHLKTFEVFHHNVSKYLYNTETLLTTTNLNDQKRIWNQTKDTIQNMIHEVHLLDIEHNHDVMNNYWKVIVNEAENINTQLNQKLFSSTNIMEKSILRRLGEGWSSNEKSDEFQSISQLNDSIEYIKQYQNFLLDEVITMKHANEATTLKKITQIKLLLKIFPALIIIISIVFLYFLYKKVYKVEDDLIESKQNLEHSLNHIQYLIDTVPVRIFWKDLECRYLGVNKLLLKDAGLEDESQIVGKTDYDLPWRDTQAKAYIEDDKEVMRTGIAKLQFEETQKRADGSVINLHTSKVPLKDKNGEVIGILGVYDDITHVKNLENEVRQQEKLLYQQSKIAAMGEMLENIAHQWRQPLSVISTSASGMQLQHEFNQLDDEYLLESIQAIMNSTKHLSETINDFRDYFKPDKEKTEFPIMQVAKKGLWLLSSKFKNRDIEVINKIEDINFVGFENEMVQCIMNILNNANDALEKCETKERLIILETKQSEKCFTTKKEECTNLCNQLIITDNAGGIPEDIMERIFEPYFTTKHQSQGTGIGLYMTKEMIEHHMNGSIMVSNEEFEHNGKMYKGAQFIISLPVQCCS